MATHSSILAWRIPWTEETGGLQSIVSQRVGHDKQLRMHARCVRVGSLILTHVPLWWAHVDGVYVWSQRACGNSVLAANLEVAYLKF